MSTVDHPRFSAVWSWLMRREPAALAHGRRLLLDGARGRVLEVGAGTGANFAHYGAGVTEVVAVEPEPSLRAQAAAAAGRAAAGAGPRITVADGTFDALPPVARGPFDVVVCSLVLCTVPDLDSALRTAHAALRPGGELRYYEHVAADGPLGALQRAVDATFWPRAFGGCHTHRDTVGAIERAGFARVRHRDVRAVPAWVPLPVAPMALGVARRPDAAQRSR
ncbi:class I SAM-dependent methyltransferase [Patulibacter sp. SYSU D01012]|uniref:class I SAM-dependent methyltransferase n=1 Tax=Patulibacter sp. SYSU D01012 TaxID=2817381 RepID=UPI001B30A320|nr:class I SAM-dependent methyltransferase [Patulibacter sp. SYSU D01012]